MSEPLELEPIKSRLAAVERSSAPPPWDTFHTSGGHHALRSRLNIIGSIQSGPWLSLVTDAPTDIAALIAEVERQEGQIQVLEDLIDEALGLIRRHGSSPIGPLEQAERFLKEQGR